MTRKVLEWVPGKWWAVEGKEPDAGPPYIPLKGPFPNRAQAQAWLDAEGGAG